MGLFWDDPKPRVTRDEFKKVRGELASHNFTEKERDRVEEIFHGDMNEDREKDKGIDEKEIERGITWMRQNMSHHPLSHDKIDILERKLKGRLH